MQTPLQPHAIVEPEPAGFPLSLHDCVAVLCWLSGMFLAFAFSMIAINFLGDFLHAPLGIKDNPPTPDALVQFSQMVFWPLVVCYGVMSLLKYITRECNALETAQFIGILAAFALAVLYVINALFHLDHPMIGTLALIAVVGGGTAADCRIAYKALSNWKNLTCFRDRLGVVIIALSTIPAFAGFLGACIPNERGLVGWAIFAGVLFYIGIATITAPVKSDTDSPSATAA